MLYLSLAREVLASALSQQLVPDGTCLGAVAGALRSARGEAAIVVQRVQRVAGFRAEVLRAEGLGCGLGVLGPRQRNPCSTGKNSSHVGCLGGRPEIIGGVSGFASEGLRGLG